MDQKIQKGKAKMGKTIVSPLEVFIVVENYVGIKTCIHLAFEYVSTTFLHPNYRTH